MPKTSEISPIEKMLLTKLMFDCSGETARALSEMMNKKVSAAADSPKVLLINDVPKLLNSEDPATTLLFTRMSGAVEGIIIVSSTADNILKTADIFLHKPLGYFKNLSDENVSVIKELANIMAGYYITALNHILHATCDSSMPELSINPRRAIENFGFGSVYTEEILVLTLKAKFEIEGGIKEDILLLFKKNDIKKILERLIVNTNVVSNMQFV